MVLKFSEKFGMDKDRKKLEAGVGKFNIVSIDIVEGKKDYEQRVDDKLIKGKIKIANIDVIMDATKDVVKYYSTASAIISSCQDIVNELNKGKMGKLSEPVHIESVESRMSENKREYIVFT